MHACACVCTLVQRLRAHLSARNELGAVGIPMPPVKVGPRGRRGRTAGLEGSPPAPGYSTNRRKNEAAGRALQQVEGESPPAGWSVCAARVRLAVRFGWLASRLSPLAPRRLAASRLAAPPPRRLAPRLSPLGRRRGWRVWRAARLATRRAARPQSRVGPAYAPRASLAAT